MRLVPDPNVPGLLNAVEADGKVVASGYLEVDYIPDTAGAHRVNGVSFVTVSDTPASNENATRQLLEEGALRQSV